MTKPPAGVRIAVIAKAPQPEKSKTRLIPALGVEGAADVARQLFTHAVRQAAASRLPVELCASPAPGHPAWEHVGVPETVAWRDQGGGDLGARMGRAVRRGVSEGDAVILMGTDCPDLTTDVLADVAARVRTTDAVLVPATDGGYTCLAVRAYHQRLFTDIPWSTATVADTTLDRCALLGWGVDVLPALSDVDTPADLGHLAALTP